MFSMTVNAVLDKENAGRLIANWPDRMNKWESGKIRIPFYTLKHCISLNWNLLHYPITQKQDWNYNAGHFNNTR